MAKKSDYNSKSRFKSDEGFDVYTRQGTTFGSITLMPPPLRSPQDTALVVELKYQYRWDLLADAYLGDVRLKWVFMRHNAISDPFYSPRVGQVLSVPTSKQIAYYLGQ